MEESTTSQLSSFLPSVLALGTLLVVAIVLTVVRPRIHSDQATSLRFLSVTGLTILSQCLHFIEELRSDFFIWFPNAFGLEPIAESRFVRFNVSWLVIWLVSLLVVRKGFVVALCPLWFLALATVLNLFAHPLLALRAGGYFPGLFTAPLVGIFGIALVRELIAVSGPETRSQGPLGGTRR